MLCQAGYGERAEERVNARKGYRQRDWDTRVGTIDLRATVDPYPRDGRAEIVPRRSDGMIWVGSSQ